MTVPFAGLRDRFLKYSQAEFKMPEDTIKRIAKVGRRIARLSGFQCALNSAVFR